MQGPLSYSNLLLLPVLSVLPCWCMSSHLDVPPADSNPTLCILSGVCHRQTVVLDRCDTPCKCLSQSLRPIKYGLKKPPSVSTLIYVLEIPSLFHWDPTLVVAWLHEKHFLTCHLIIASACAHLNLFPSLFLTIATLSAASSLSPHHPDPASRRPPCHGRRCFLPSVSARGLPAGQSAVRGPDGRPAWHLPLHRGWRAGVLLSWVPERGLGLRELLRTGWVCCLQSTEKVPYWQESSKVFTFRT